MCDANLEIPVSNVVQRGRKVAVEVQARARGTGAFRLIDRSVAHWEQSSSPVDKSSRLAQPSHSYDTDANSSGNDSAERECCDHVGQETSTCSSHNGKDSAMETTESKSSHSHSLASSSAAYSLLSGGSERDQPSTSGCSSERPARSQTQKELLRALRELKVRMPPDQWAKDRSSTLASLQYALKCIKQVRANQEYYHQWSIEENQGCCLDLSAFTIEELDNITSEYTLRNADTFSVAISFLSGKVAYISPQVSSLLCCKPEKLQGALFSELLAPQDVRTFYSGTAPCRLPRWTPCTRAVSTVERAPEKPVFCRLSGGRGSGGEAKYRPFRLTPYQLSLRDSDTSQPEPCCLLIAERVHSGYEAPRIPADKRVFTTSHTPGCLFQEVDERAVPLLGYLPQDLIGNPLLMYLHPEDRSLMVDIHKKILQYAGQPFDHSPLRMCARSGEYLTVDTSWSSFINPWSRKVSFIMGRHKVRTTPLNEDVFTAVAEGAVRTMSPEVAQLSEQIHRLLAPPVHGCCALAYSSVGSIGSQERQASGPDSSDGNAVPAREPPNTGRVTCEDVHMEQSSHQPVPTASRNRALPCKTTCSGDMMKPAGAESTSRESQQVAALGPKSQVSTELPGKGLPVPYSYQQINCLDSIIRYLESCNVPNTVKRKCGSSSYTTSSTSDEAKHRKSAGAGEDIVNTLEVAEVSKVIPMESTHSLTPLALHCKAESVVSVTSQCSFSSTIVHVGDKKPPEPDILMTEESLSPPAPPAAAPQNCTTSMPARVAPQPASCPGASPTETEGRRGGGGVPRLGLTKEVLTNHTEREEQTFLSRFSDLSRLCVTQPSTPPRRHTAVPRVKGIRSTHDNPVGGGSGRRRGRRGKRIKHQSEGPFPNTQSLPTPGAEGPGASNSTFPWASPTISQAHGPPIPTPYPPGCLPFYPLFPPFPAPPVDADPRMETGSLGSPTGPRFPTQASPILPATAARPVLAFILPGCVLPQLTAYVQPHGQDRAEPARLSRLPAHFGPAVGQAAPDALPFHPGTGQFCPLASQLSPAPAQLAMPLQFCNPSVMTQNGAPEAPNPATAISAPPPRGPSHSSSPPSTSQLVEHEGAGSPLFNSRCSSPLNLLQLEEFPSNRNDVTQLTPPPGGCLTQGVQTSVTCSSSKDNTDVNESNQDAMSTSSDLLDLLLHEDSRSGASSAASGVDSSGSNGCSVAGSHGPSYGSSNTSKYFGSVESSENDQGHKVASGDSGEEHFMKNVLQDPVWLIMANTDEKVMMTYQLPSRDRDAVLREDREALRRTRLQQPHFTDEQCRELSEVHPWLQNGFLPSAVSISSCRGCGSPTEAAPPPPPPPPPPFDLELAEMDLSGDLREQGGPLTGPVASAVVPDGERYAETKRRQGEDSKAGSSRPHKASWDAETTSSGELRCRES
ncbi:period circadian protein homolog 1a [Electrophorus electricus]|uniref:period circadian protein homolog 1a n=1 Tax=Electrophorus electricus TaxID=8005 RepID=UPI0015D07AE5|nr:period circadian protein homolog 1a [Electrophorus electricus]XP_035391436.1 period circadian protein homolog 1a [Electrophorus electricus]XP_035391437.1 period circadian protein homolog 1a [Electrophorus electricus]